METFDGDYWSLIDRVFSIVLYSILKYLQQIYLAIVIVLCCYKKCM